MMKNLKLILCLIAIACVGCSAVFQPHWRNYCAWVIQQHEKSCWAPVIVAAPLPPPASLQGLPEQDTYFLPDVIVWDPLKQYPAISANNPDVLSVCYEEGCGLPLKLLCWQDGRKPRYNPRCLYGVSGITVLLCQIYTCSQNHFITTCDPRVQKTFSNHAIVPFVLLHRTGITQEACHTIFDMASQGTSFADIEAFLLWRCQEKHSITYLHMQELQQRECPIQPPPMPIQVYQQRSSHGHLYNDV